MRPSDVRPEFSSTVSAASVPAVRTGASFTGVTLTLLVALPVLNAVLFSLYHFWTPWQNIGRILGLLPWIYTVWRKRSVALSMAIHISVNCIFLLLVLAAVTAD